MSNQYQLEVPTPDGPIRLFSETDGYVRVQHDGDWMLIDPAALRAMSRAIWAMADMMEVPRD